MNLTWNPWKPLQPAKMILTTPCNCHDPIVFGHVSCKLRETQPNNQAGTTYHALNATISMQELAAHADAARIQLERMMLHLSESCGEIVVTSRPPETRKCRRCAGSGRAPR